MNQCSGPGRSEIHMLSNVHVLITRSWHRPRHLNLEVIKSFGLLGHVLSGHNMRYGVRILLVSSRRNAVSCPVMHSQTRLRFSRLTNEKVCPTRCCSASVKEGVRTSTTAWITQMRAAEAKAQRPTWAVCSHLAHVVQFNAEPHPRRPQIQSL